jgi:2'-5' RNA ligase
MHHVVHLNLESEVDEQIRSLWRRFVEQEICSPEIASYGRPHVTVMGSAPFSVANLRQNFVSVAASMDPFEIRFSHLGVFLESKPALFLGVTPTAALRALHRRFFDLISPSAEVFDFAKPDAIVFHCTLGLLSRPQDVPRAVELACAVSLPCKALVNSFDVVQCGTDNGPESFTFGAGNTTPDNALQRTAIRPDVSTA